MSVFKEKETLNINQLQTPRKESTMTPSQKETARSAIECLKEIIQEKQDDYFYILTNKKTAHDPKYYSLYFDKEKVELIEKNHEAKKKSDFFYKNEVLEINGQKCKADFLSEFNRKIDKIVDELKVGKATLWEPTKK